MIVLSLFDGISCARVALEKAGISVEKYYASEVDLPAMKISMKNWPDNIQVGDVKKLKANSTHKGFFPALDWGYLGDDIDLLIGGSPCQDLSIATKNRKGLEGSRSSLFWEYVRVLKQCKPKYFILENVASMPIEARAIITKALGVEPIMIDASLVSAQRRKRLFWTNIPGVVLPKDRGLVVRNILQSESEVDEKYYIKPEVLNKILEKMAKGKSIPQSLRIHSIDKKGVTLSALGGGLGAKTGLYIIIPEATKKGYAVAYDGDAIDLSFPSSATRRGRVGDKVKNLMTSQNISVFTQGRVRRLTPVECSRLQGLKDDYTEGESDSQRYKMSGNAFHADVVAHILSFIHRDVVYKGKQIKKVL